MSKIIGFIRNDELVNILNALGRTGALDQRTLSIVAEATGVSQWVRQQPQMIVVEVVQRPALKDGRQCS